MRLSFKLLLRAAFAVIIIVAAILLVRAFDARDMADLKPWHREVLDADVTAADLDQDSTLADYLAFESRVFSQLEEQIYTRVAPSDRLSFNRFYEESVSFPERFEQNWNRTFERVPAAIKGGVLLIHGLTDSPYSMRHVANIFEAQGFYVLVLRMPGHGTAPVGITTATWQDWMAAARLGVRHVRERIGPDLPLHLGGYSNGGALVTKYVLDAIEQAHLEMPSRLFLFSPMIGVTEWSRFASWNKVLSYLDYFEKFRWQSIEPEYDPFKYNSFPKEAGHQTYLLTTRLQEQIADLAQEDRLGALPPILTFQSLVDSTVKTNAIVEKLYAALPNNGSELILFDMNRQSELGAFVHLLHDTSIEDITARLDLRYTLTLITNASQDTAAIVEKSKKSETASFEERELGGVWPTSLFSLSHVSLIFPPDDPLYGDGAQGKAQGLPLGSLSPRGEKNVLRVPLDQLMRVRFNPFFDYLKERLTETIKD